MLSLKRRKKHLIILVLNLVVMSFFILTGLITNKGDIVSIKGLPARLVHFTQKWEFFTKSPNDLQLHLYFITDSLKSVEYYPYNNTLTRNLLGLKKGDRLMSSLINQELMKRVKILAENQDNNRLQIDPISEDFGENTIDSLQSEELNYIFINDFKFLDTGKYLAVIKKPVPWLWYSKNADATMPGYYFIIDIF